MPNAKIDDAVPLTSFQVSITDYTSKIKIIIQFCLEGSTRKY